MGVPCGGAGFQVTIGRSVRPRRPGSVLAGFSLPEVLIRTVTERLLLRYYRLGAKANVCSGLAHTQMNSLTDQAHTLETARRHPGESSCIVGEPATPAPPAFIAWPLRRPVRRPLKCLAWPSSRAGCEQQTQALYRYKQPTLAIHAPCP